MRGMHPQLRRSRALAVVFGLMVATLAVVDGGTPAAADGPTLIDFEESIPTPGNVTSQYCNSATYNKGVEFLEPVRLIEPAVGTMTLTHAATNHFIGDEFTEPNVMRIGFTADQSFVSVRVGLDQDYNFAVTAYLRAYTTPTPTAGSQISGVGDQVLLGDTATTINQQLYVSTGLTPQIRSIEIEFAGPDPVNAAFEVIDNLLYPTLGPQCGSDTIGPIVEILEPDVGDPFYGSPSGGDVELSLHLRASDSGTGVAVVDVEFLDSANATLDSFSVCGGTNAPGCPVPSPTVERKFSSFMPSGTAALRVTARDFAGNEGVATRGVAITTSTANLWARGLEITQATQPWVATNTSTRRDPALNPPTFGYPAVPESVPLVAGRTTVARFFVGVEGTIGGAALPGVGAALRCYAESSYTIACPGPSEIYPEHQPPKTTKTISVDPTQTLREQREESTRTLNFVLPDEWTSVGVIHLEASVTPPVPECAGCADAANTIRVRYIPFRGVPNWHSMVRQVLVDRISYGTATSAEREAAIDFIRRIYPIDESTIMNGFAIMPYLWISFPGLGGPDCSEFLSDLRSTYDYLLDDYGYKAVWALTDSQAPKWCSGLGNAGGVAVSRGERWDSGAHEIGHAVGLLHTGPKADAHGNECAGDGWCDGDWPWQYGGIGDFGFDVLRFEVHDPGDPPTDNDDHDVMSYGKPRWISSRNWIRIFNALAGWSFPYPKASAAATAIDEAGSEVLTPTPHLLVRGRYDPVAMQWELAPLYQVDRLPSTAEPEYPDLVVELLDGAGTVLATQAVDLPDSDHIDTDDPNDIEIPDPSFVRYIEMAPGTERVNLREADALVATRGRSESSPALTIVTPTAAGFTGTIRWEAADADADSLVAWVDYRHRPEAPWQPLGIDLEDDVLGIDPALLPGGSAAQVRVTVSDGFNTAVAISEEFTVPDKAPQAEILRPSTGDIFEAGRRITLRGNAADPEDETLFGNDLVWTSSLDGLLGTGTTIDVPGLSAGIHLITLTATDSSGNADEATVAVLVAAQPAVNHQPTANAGPDQPWSSSGIAVLDGTASSDADADSLTFHWSLVSVPDGALAFIVNPNAAQPVLIAGTSGTYEIELVVHDGMVGSRPDRVVLQQDLGAPSVQVEVPAAGVALQDGITFTASASDAASGVAAVWFTFREDDGGDGLPIGFEHLDATYDSVSGRWIHAFDTTAVPDGYYSIVASAEDAVGNPGASEIVRFSVRNWAVVEMLPATPNHNAGRTMPVRFSVSVNAAVDPAMPFVHNEDLTVLIYETAAPDVILQEATFGFGSTDYRIDDTAGFYITNFKTLRKATEYTVEVRRDTLVVGSFTFATVRTKRK